jgi:hypothetical protein
MVFFLAEMNINTDSDWVRGAVKLGLIVARRDELRAQMVRFKIFEIFE